MKRTGRSSLDPPEDLWAVTSYFNPLNYRRRRRNYELFRKNLVVPLVTIELSYHDDFELGDGDATLLVRLRSDQIMWQKERLLNLALQHLPPQCSKVAWLDCDLIFERKDWGRLASRELDKVVMLQPYSRVYDLKRNPDMAGSRERQSFLQRDSMADLYVNGKTSTCQVSMDMRYAYSPGHAWAMRRDVLEQVGLYDRLILGGGDQLIAQAAVGEHENVVRSYGMKPMQSRDYLDWAGRFHRIVNGSLGVVPGNLYHLWHGELDDRRYRERHSVLIDHDFDPSRDITIDGTGCWRWETDKPQLQEDVRAYFRGRREDG